MTELIELLSEEHRKELSAAIRDKMLDTIQTVDVTAMKAEIQEAVLNEIKECLDANYLSDAVEWNEIGEYLGKTMLSIIKKTLKGE